MRTHSHALSTRIYAVACVDELSRIDISAGATSALSQQARGVFRWFEASSCDLSVFHKSIIIACQHSASRVHQDRIQILEGLSQRELLRPPKHALRLRTQGTRRKRQRRGAGKEGGPVDYIYLSIYPSIDLSTYDGEEMRFSRN